MEAAPKGVPRSGKVGAQRWQQLVIVAHAASSILNPLRYFSSGLMPTQSLVFAGIVFAEECGQALIEFAHGLTATDIDVVILYRAPQARDHNVFQSAAFAVHAVTEPPADQIAARSIHHRRQVDMAISEWNVGDEVHQT